MKEKIHQHYVPVLYLKWFGINGIEGRKSQIYFYDKVQQKHGKIAADKIAYENNYYDIENEEHTKIIEDFFAMVESSLSPLFDRICKSVTAINSEERKIHISEEDRKLLSVYVAFQKIRTPNFRGYLNECYETVKEVIPDKSVEYDKKDIQRIHARIILKPEMSNYYANFLDDRNAVFILNTTETPFYTSDNPAFFFHRKSNSELDPDTSLFFPLNPYVAVEFFHKNHKRRYDCECLVIKQNESAVAKMYNKYNLMQCSRFVFSNVPIQFD